MRNDRRSYVLANYRALALEIASARALQPFSALSQNRCCRRTPSCAPHRERIACALFGSLACNWWRERRRSARPPCSCHAAHARYDARIDLAARSYLPAATRGKEQRQCSENASHDQPFVFCRPVVRTPKGTQQTTTARRHSIMRLQSQHTVRTTPPCTQTKQQSVMCTGRSASTAAAWPYLPCPCAPSERSATTTRPG